jgi:hypothetical protein
MSTSYYDSIVGAPLAPGATESQCAGPSGRLFDFESNYTKLKQSYTSIRGSQCVSDSLKYAEEVDAVVGDITRLTDDKETEKTKFEAYVGTVEILQNARGPFDTYMAELIQEETDLNKEYIQLQQGIRAGRRRFLDAGPQDGVTSIVGLQTADDKILLVFWICFGMGILLMGIVLLKHDGGVLNIQQKITILLVGLALSMGIAHYFIRTFG